MQGIRNTFDPVLIPPRELIIQNGIGVGDLENVEMEFGSIGRGNAKGLMKNGLLPSHTVPWT